jgi:hypothetical protein
MKERNVILGEFENWSYAQIAKRDLRRAGINTKLLKERNRNSQYLKEQDEGVTLIVSNAKFEEARKILTTRFI